MFEADEWKTLILKLKQLTKDEKIHWESDDWDQSLKTNVGPVTYKISALDSDDRPPWTLSVVRNTSGSAETIASLDSAPGDQIRDPQSMLFDLRDLAYRESLGGPQLVREILADLMKIDPTEPMDPSTTPF